MIKVLEFTTRFEIGGSEGQLVRLLEGIDRERFEPQVACLRRRGALLKPIEARGIPITEYPAPHLYGATALAQQVRFGARLRAEHTDIVHALGFYSNVFAIPAARLAGTPVVIGSVREHADQWTAAQTAANRMALALADAVVVNAVAVRDELVSHGFSPHKLHVIRNGIDVERFSLPRGAGTLREELHWPADAPIVAVLSRITPKKGIEDFLAAARALANARGDTRFLLVGDGSIVKGGEAVPSGQRHVIEALADDLGLGDRVRFTGFRIDVPEILSQVDIVVVPSLSEALSNSLLEAMAAGVPVVSTRVGDHALVIEQGASGFLVPPGDADAMVRRIGQLLDDRAFAASLGDAGRKVVKTRFSLARMVKETEALYEDLLAPKRGTARTSRVDVATVTDEAGLRALAPEWTALHARVGHDHPFVSHEWVQSWWQAFGAGHQLHVVVARRGGECIGIAPFMQGPARMYGVPFEQLELIGNVHTPRNDLLCAEPAAYDAMVAHVVQHRSWDLLVLPQLVDGSPTVEEISRLSVDQRLRTGLWVGQASPVLRLSGDLATRERLVSAKQRANLRNKARRLAKLGPVDIETITGGAGLSGAVAEGLLLEAAAWKSANGTAIVSDPDAERFYTSLAEAMAARGWLELRFLRVGGRRIAFAYGLHYGDTLFMLKQGYDPKLHDCSPGMLMWQRIIEDGYQRGIAAIDFLGDAEPWKLSLGAELRRHYWLFGFPPGPRALLLHALKFTVAPALRERRARLAAAEASVCTPPAIPA